ncbi:hypothetical protein AVEN_99947-1 [Araneus ventricosus]|uniref:Uncharacterized protein n=1 Tax=Araneus ventricosus TaxID=182803 RepID=A0A4Y2H4B8_ARAVE|nr:hypothetical protein AVEN_99947-1 [Araneus ventricosus]
MNSRRFPSPRKPLWELSFTTQTPSLSLARPKIRLARIEPTKPAEAGVVVRVLKLTYSEPSVAQLSAQIPLNLMMRTTPGLAPPLQASTPHQPEDVCAPTYVLASNRPNTQRIFSGIGFGTWNTRAPRPMPYH